MLKNKIVSLFLLSLWITLLYSVLVVDFSKQHPLFQFKDTIALSGPQVECGLDLEPDHYLLKIIYKVHDGRRKTVIFNDEIIPVFQVRRKGEKETDYFHISPEQIRRDNLLKIDFAPGFPEKVKIKLQNYRHAFIANSVIAFFRPPLVHLVEFSPLRTITVFLLSSLFFAAIVFGFEKSHRRKVMRVFFIFNMLLTGLAISNFLPLTPHVVFISPLFFASCYVLVAFVTLVQAILQIYTTRVMPAQSNGLSTSTIKQKIFTGLFVNAIQFCFSDKEFGMRRKILPEKPPSDYIMFPFIGLLVFFVFMPFYTNIFYTWHDYFLFTDFPRICKSISKMLQGRMAQGRFLSGFTWITLNYLQLKIQDIRLIAVLIKLLQFVNASLFCFFLYKIYVKISRNWKFAILVTILTINLTGFLFYFVTNYTVLINSFIFVPLISVCLVADHRKSIIRNKKTFFFAILLCCASLSSYNWHAFVVPSFAVFTLLFAPTTTEEKYRTTINILTIFFFACIVYFVFTKILILSLQLLPPNESHAFTFSFQNIINGLSFHFHYVLNFWFINKGLFDKFYIIPQIVLIFAIILFIRQEFILSKHKFSVLAFRFGIMICAIGFCQSYFVVRYPHFVRIHLGLALMCLFFCVWLVQKALKKIDTLGGFNISVAISVLMIFIVIAAGHFNQNHYYIKPAQNEFAFIKGALTPLKEGRVDVVRIKKGPYLWIQHDTYGSTVFSRFEFAPFAVRGLVSHAYSDLHGLPSTLSSINNSVLNFQIDDKKQYFDISEKNGRSKNVILTFDGARAHAITKSAMRRTVISLPPVRRQVTLVQEGYCGYNIIKLDHRFVAVRQDLGRLDFWDGRLADIKAWPYIISGDATVAVNEEIVKRGGDISQYKVFDYKGGVVAANVSLGKVDPTTELIGTRELPPFLFVGWTKEEVLKKVDTRSEK